MNNSPDLNMLLDGVYFDMPDAQYHALHRLSASGMKNILVSIPTFWAKSWMNPDKAEADDDTKAKVLGRAYHCATFEPEALAERFIGCPDYETIEGILMTDAAVCRELKERGETQKKAGESALERAVRLQGTGYDGPIKAVMEFEFDAQAGDRTRIDEPYWSQLQRDVGRIHENQTHSEMVTGGASEVTILWTCPDSGIPMKARLDKLKADMIVDLKSFANAVGKETRQCVREAIQYNKYYLSMRFYQIAVEMIGKLDLKVMSNLTQERGDLISALRNRTAPLDAWLLFQEKNGVPNLLARKLRFHNLPDGVEAQDIGAEDHQIARHKSILAHKADMEIDYAKTQYLRAMQLYGEDQVWFGFNLFDEIGDEDFSEYFLESKPE